MRLGLALCLILGNYSLHAQGIQVRLDSCGEVGLLHAHRVNPITGYPEWANVTQVVQEEAFFDVEPLGGERWLLESPPWSWVLTTRLNEQDVAVLTCPKQVPMRLRNVMGSVRWEDEKGMPSNHPHAVIQELELAIYREGKALEFDLLSASGAIGRRSELVLDSIWSVADRAMQEMLSNAEEAMEDPWALDAVRLQDLRWLQMTGAADSTLQRRFTVWMRTELRSTEELIRSPYFVQCANLAWSGWWKSLDQEALLEAVVDQDEEFISNALGAAGVSPEIEEWAWWIWALVQPNHPLVSAVFQQWTGSDFMVLGLVELIRPSPVIAPEAWTTRSGGLEPIASAGNGKHLVLLIVKNGSVAALRERALFGTLAEANRRRDVEFLVVSIDGSQDAWNQTMADRTVRGEQIRWVGNDPRAMEAWGISTVPFVVVLGPDGDVIPGVRRLPSEGLGADIERWPR